MPIRKSCQKSEHIGNDNHYWAPLTVQALFQALYMDGLLLSLGYASASPRHVPTTIPKSQWPTTAEACFSCVVYWLWWLRLCSTWLLQHRIQHEEDDLWWDTSVLWPGSKGIVTLKASAQSWHLSLILKFHKSKQVIGPSPMPMEGTHQVMWQWAQTWGNEQSYLHLYLNWMLHLIYIIH